ncbi:MAG: amylo-alpha-1,6-glucosidase [Candidatus Acidifodinimicrobium sp.]
MDKVNVLSKNGMFIFRFNDGEFGSKWCGIWNEDTKLVDYFAFKVNGEYLSSKNVNAFQIYNTQLERYDYKVGNINASEDVFCSDNQVIVTLKSSAYSDVEAEIGVNIRKREENYIPDKTYNLEVIRNGFKVGYKDRTLYVYFNRGDFNYSPIYGKHTPGEYARSKGFSKYFDDASEQNKFIPGIIKASLKEGEEFNIIFSTQKMEEDMILGAISSRLRISKDYNDLISIICDSYGYGDVFDRNFMKDVIDSLFSYVNLQKKKIYAGFPYFNQFWIRDALFILPSFININQPNFVRDVIKNIVALSSDKGVPNIAGSSLFPMDTMPLLIIDVLDYYLKTGDTQTLLSLDPWLNKFVYIMKNRLEGNFIHDKGRETWMDSMDREYSIEIQALWLRAMQDLIRIERAYGKEDTRIPDIIDKLRNGLGQFKRRSYLSDQLNKDINSANQLFVPFLLDSDEELNNIVIDNLKQNLLTDYGVLSVAKTDHSFDPKGYQNGAVWPFLSSIAAGVAFKLKDYNLGRDIISIIKKKNFDVQCSSRINEIFEPNGKPQGCVSQAWSIGMIPRIIDDYFIGVRVDEVERRLLIDQPPANLTFYRNLTTLGKRVKLEFKDGKVSSDLPISKEGEKLVIDI